MYLVDYVLNKANNTLYQGQVRVDKDAITGNTTSVPHGVGRFASLTELYEGEFDSG